MSAHRPATDGGRELRILEIIETARSKRPRFRDERITLTRAAAAAGVEVVGGDTKVGERGAAERALAALRAVPGCEQAAAIGEVQPEPPGMVLVQTSFGGRRVMDQLVGDPLPRIC